MGLSWPGQHLYRAWPLLDYIVAPGGGNHLTVRCTVKLREFPDRRSVTAQFVRVDRGWHFICAEERGEERLRRLSVAVFLQKNVQHSAMLVHRTPAARLALESPFWPRITSA